MNQIIKILQREILPSRPWEDFFFFFLKGMIVCYLVVCSVSWIRSSHFSLQLIRILFALNSRFRVLADQGIMGIGFASQARATGSCQC